MTDVSYDNEYEPRNDHTPNGPRRSWLYKLIVKLSGGKLKSTRAVNIVYIQIVAIAIVIALMASSSDGQTIVSESQPILKSNIPPDMQLKYTAVIEKLPDPFYIEDLPANIRKEIAAQ